MENRKIRLLEADEIEVRVNQVSAKGASALLYKTARVDYEILDETYGQTNWQIDYQEIKGNLYCTIRLWDAEKGQWIAKQNCGVESREDGNGNEKKGEASDAAKRAGTVVGIGRELYSSPFVWLRVKTGQISGKWQIVDENGNMSRDKYAVSEIGYDSKRRINRLVIVNQKTGEVVYTYGSKTAQKAPEKPAKKPEKAAPTAEVSTAQAVPGFDSKVAYEAFIAKHKLTQAQFVEWRNRAAELPGTGIEKKPFKALTPDEWQRLLATLEMLKDNGVFDE